MNSLVLVLSQSNLYYTRERKPYLIWFSSRVETPLDFTRLATSADRLQIAFSLQWEWSSFPQPISTQPLFSASTSYAKGALNKRERVLCCIAVVPFLSQPMSPPVSRFFIYLISNREKENLTWIVFSLNKEGDGGRILWHPATWSLPYKLTSIAFTKTRVLARLCLGHSFLRLH